MKKIIFMLFALSSVAFADIIHTGSNSDKNATAEGASASININVSAIVSGENPSLVITDTSGKEISGVSFIHYLKTNGNNSSDLTHSLDIQARSEYFTGIHGKGTNSVEISNNGVATLTGTNSANMIQSQITAAKGTIDSVNGILPINLTNAFTNSDFTPDTYTSSANKLTVSFTKTAKGQF